MTDLWYGTSGPQDAKIVLVGESWGFEEAQAKRPFVGSSGTELNRMLAEAGIKRDDILCTNVVADRPHQNEMWRYFAPIDHKPTRVQGIAPMPKVCDEINRLYQQIAAHPRSVIIATGNWSLWALTQQTKAKRLSEYNGRKIPKELQTWAPSGIQSWRGSMWYCEPHQEFLRGLDPFATGLAKTQLLPIIHPAAIMRDWTQRAVTVHDLKSRVPMALRGDWRRNPSPIYWAPPTLAQLRNRILGWLARADGGSDVLISQDIETARGLITCLGLSDGPNFAMSIPFIRKENDNSFASWWNPTEEAEVIHLLRRLNQHPRIKIIGQNFIYDTQYIQHWLGVTPRLFWDTMLCQNVLFPGTPKDLSYLSSLYCDYHWYWKEDHKEWDLSGTIEDLLVYNCEDCVRTWGIAQAQMQLTKHLGQEEQMAFKMETNHLCLRMMNRGVLGDQKRREVVRMDLNNALNEIHDELLQIVPQDLVRPHDSKFKTMWYSSPQQTASLFYDIFGFPEVKHRKTGSRTVGKEALDVLRRKAPEFTQLFNLLDQAGSIENSLDICGVQLDPDFRLRCSYNPGGTETHRLSSSKNAFGRGTNLQNLSKGEEDE